MAWKEVVQLILNQLGAEVGLERIEARSLRGMDLRRAFLVHNQDGTAEAGGLSGWDLREVNLAGADLRGFKFQNCDFRGADLRGALVGPAYPWIGGNDQFADSDFRGADLDKIMGSAGMGGADLRGASLRGAMLGYDDLGAILAQSDFRGADLRGARLDGARLERCIFDDADLRGAFFSNGILRWASLRRVDARGASFSNADLSNLWVEEAQDPSFLGEYRGWAWREAFLRGANLSGWAVRDLEMLRRAHGVRRVPSPRWAWVHGVPFSGRIPGLWFDHLEAEPGV